MARIIWNDIGQQIYHTGVDRGMFYLGTVAVPWFGLVSVTESPSGGDPDPVYLDGQKVLNIPGGVDFDATIQAFSAPVEFSPCAGHLQLAAGLYATNQPKETFGFSYRTLIGNDVLSTDFGYKIHVVYNATARISDFSHATITDSVSAEPYSWSIDTTPIEALLNKRPTSHFIFDTRKLSTDDINLVESILYGDDDDPRMPTIEELGTILS